MRADRYRESNLRAYDGPLAERYDDWLPVRLLRVWEMDHFVLRTIGEDIGELTILDVGCGTGRLLRALKDAGATGLCGIDVAPAVVEVARARLVDASVDLRVADAEGRIPWPEGFFDVVAATGVLHHFTALEQAVSEIRRVLAPGGRLIAADACFFTPLREVFNAMLLIHPHQGDFRFYRPAWTSRVLSESGLQVNLVRRLNWWSYGICAERPPDSAQRLQAVEAAGAVT
jgi:SAM-dependent methyltransferase